jgi:hypothetical protein
MVLHPKWQAQSETIRIAVENLQTSMKDYKSLMTESTQHRIDTVVNFGAVIAEACRIFRFLSISYTLQMGPFAKLAFGLAKGIFDVGFSLCLFCVVRALHLSGI